MKVIIVEDEYAAARNLVSILNEIDPDIIILDIIESVKDLQTWLHRNEFPDLGFFDIQLSDGNVFELLKYRDLDFPVIFTTAYNHYAIDAFKVNGIDYILKPINTEDVRYGIKKYKSLTKIGSNLDSIIIKSIIDDISEKESVVYKNSFLIPYKDKLIPVETITFAYFFISDSVVQGTTFDKKVYVISYTLDEIENMLEPNKFIRVNRQFIINKDAVVELIVHFNSRYKIKVKPSCQLPIISSKTRSSYIKQWLES